MKMSNFKIHGGPGPLPTPVNKRETWDERK